MRYIVVLALAFSSVVSAQAVENAYQTSSEARANIHRTLQIRHYKCPGCGRFICGPCENKECSYRKDYLERQRLREEQKKAKKRKTS